MRARGSGRSHGGGPARRGVVRIATRIFAPEVAAAAFRLRLLAAELGAAGHPVEVVTTTPPRGLESDDTGLSVSRWPALRDEQGNIRGYLHYLSFDLPLVARLLARRRPALLVVEPPPTTAAVVRVVAALQRAPYVYYAGDVWSDGAASAGAPGVVVRALRLVEGWAMRGARVVLAVSDGVAERLAPLGVDAGRVVVVGNGVDTDVFRPSGEEVPVDAGCLADGLFVYSGTMSEWQGVEVLVRAFAEHHRSHPRARLVLLGQGSDVPRLRTLADELGGGAIELAGVVPPAVAAAWLRTATAALVSIRPGLGYDFARPTKIYAATACGTPVIFAGVGAGHDLVAGERLGWSPGYDVGAVAEAMGRAVEQSPAERAELGHHLVGWTAEHASLRAMVAHATREVLARTGLTDAAGDGS